MSSGADITAAPKDLTLAASWNGDGLLSRVFKSVQNTGAEKVYFCELASAPAALTDNRWQFIPAGGAVDLMNSGNPIWARCEDGKTSTLAAIVSGRPTRYL
ncbi:MAG: hypothetical protein OXH66_14345 [Gemmatimonadetes bacterium]|nr:hypothetical protein [Gemmatimonadota bacterium]